jgi:multidrug resistance efflux pump
VKTKIEAELEAAQRDVIDTEKKLDAAKLSISQAEAVLASDQIEAFDKAAASVLSGKARISAYANHLTVARQALDRAKKDAAVSRLALTDRVWFGETDRDLGVVGVGELSACGVTSLVRPS